MVEYVLYYANIVMAVVAQVDWVYTGLQFTLWSLVAVCAVKLLQAAKRKAARENEFWKFAKAQTEWRTKIDSVEIRQRLHRHTGVGR